MDYLILFGILSFLSFIVLGAMVFLGLKRARSLERSALDKIISENSDFFEREIGARTKLIADNFKSLFGHPEFLKLLEIFLRRVRIVVLKIENFLLSLIDYLRGKRKINSATNEHSSEFLKEINDWKNKNNNK